MPEHETFEPDPYWTEDLSLGEGQFYNLSYPLRLALHQSSERYYHRQELFPLLETSGTRQYFHARPYVLLPDVTIQVRLYDQPKEIVIGETETVLPEGARREYVGNAQAWFYSGRDKALMLWECFLEKRHRLTNPVEDENLQTIWNGFEQAILSRSKGVKRLYTTSEDIYARPAWKRFLEQHGYQQTAPALFEKGIAAVHR